MINKITLKENIELLTKETSDVLINIKIDEAEAFIKSYCNITELTDNMFYTLQRLTIFLMQVKDTVKSEDLGEFSITYQNNIPKDLLQQLNKFKQPKFW